MGCNKAPPTREIECVLLQHFKCLFIKFNEININETKNKRKNRTLDLKQLERETEMMIEKQILLAIRNSLKKKNKKKHTQIK